MPASNIPPSISDAPTPPQRSDSQNFAARADTFLLWLATTFITELNAVLLWIKVALTDVQSASAVAAAKAAEVLQSENTASTKAAEALASAVAASSSATTATNKAAEATASAVAAAASAVQGQGYANVTSVSAQSLSVGIKTWQVASPKAFTVGQDVRIARSVATYMDGQITATTNNSITVNVNRIQGAETSGTWSFSINAVNVVTADWNAVNGQGAILNKPATSPLGLQLMAIDSQESLNALAVGGTKYFVSAASPVPVGIAEHSAVGLPDGRAFIYGANPNSLATWASFTYNPETNAWTVVAEHPLSSSGGVSSTKAVSLSDGRVLVVGGISAGGGRTAAAFIYNSNLNNWQAAAPLPAPVFWHSAAELGSGKVLVCGGDTAVGSSSKSYVYQISSNTWTEVAPMPVALNRHAAAGLSGGRVLVCGGHDISIGTSSAGAYIYDSISNTWTVCASLPLSGKGHTAVTLEDGRIFVTGVSPDGSGRNNAFVYNPALNTWKSVTSMPTAKLDHASAPLSNGRVLICGGYINSQRTSEAHIYQPTI